MKCVKLKEVISLTLADGSVADKVIRRVSNEFAAKLVKKGKAEYVPKSEWKEAGRNR